ncbi:LamG domain-containing protein [Streptomyces sp. NPDC020965]|uniref:LamG domain-containing protein n=1 Tax=Streptomyces sp. NPDC020965 TaxID=3365105 RepID=UPI0037976EBB
MALIVSALAAGLLSAPAHAAPAANPSPQSPPAAERSPTERAAATGTPVEVISERTEYSRTTANPDGTYTLTQSVTPQRMKHADGSWRELDTTLERRPDGTVGPRAAAVGLSFSGGGDGKDMVRLSGGKGSVTLGWPGRLPAPILQEATATYPEVLPGVDLRLTATTEGYHEVLIVKSAQAAVNPALDEVSLPVTSDGLTVAPGEGGGLRAFDEDGNTVFSGPPGLMWDSAGSATPPPVARSSRPARTAAATEADTAPGMGDASAELPIRVGAGAVAVTPDLGLLRGPDTVYPVYIDPSMGLGVSERTVLSSNGSRFPDFTGDLGVGRCYRVGPYYCDADHTNRMYFEFGPASLVGKYVIDATFRAYETWSFSCTPHWIQLWRTENISAATRWPGPQQLDLMGDRQVSAGRGDHCTPAQPDRWIEFNDAPSEPEENLTKTVRAFADGRFTRLTLMLRAQDENNADAWKRFKENAEIQVVYVLKPGAPTDDGVIPGNGDIQGCSTTDQKPVIATRLDPMFQGRVRTSVAPKPGLEEQGSLRAHFWYERKMPDGTWQADRLNVPTSGYLVHGDLARPRLPGGVDGALYRVRSLTQSFWTYEGITTAISSGYRRWCYFKLDTVAPSEPRVTATGVYQECVSSNDCPALGGPGVRGSFRIRPNIADDDITGYRWRLRTERGAALESGTDVTIEPRPTTAGIQVLEVEAIDVRERTSVPALFRFRVRPAEGAVGRWHFDDGTPGSGVVTAADSATVGVRRPITLRQGAGVADWSALGRGGTGDHSLRLNDDVTDPARQTAYADTSAPPVNTRDSFTVSAWVRLNDDGKTRVVASAPGAENTAAFNLFYSGSAKKWVFNRGVADSATPAYVSSLAETANPPLRVWTHLAGVFDTQGDTRNSNDTIQLYVNGRPQGAPVVVDAANPAYIPWASSVGMRVGASKAGEHLVGRIDELAVWQRPLTDDEVAEESRYEVAGIPATELVAYWDTASAAGGKVPELSPYAPGPMDLSASGAVADPDENEVRLDGASGHLSTTGPVVDETGSFTVTAAVKLDADKMLGLPVGGRAQVLGQAAAVGRESTWALWVERISAAPDGFQWKFGRTSTDGSGRVVATASAPSGEAAEFDTWVQVTGVYDATAIVENGPVGALRLYLGAVPQPSLDDESVFFSDPQHGAGAISAGRGGAKGVTGHHLPGAIREMRVWTGAMARDQILDKVMGTPGAE